MSRVLRLVLWTCVCTCVVAEKWRWPDLEPASAVRIDNKVRFVDSLDSTGDGNRQKPQGVQADEEQSQDLRLPYSAEGAGGSAFGQYVNYRDRRPQSQDWLSTFDDEGLKQCKCTSDTRCIGRNDIPHACASGQHLCCFQRSHKLPQQSDFFNEIDNKYVNDVRQQQNGEYFVQNTPVLVGPGGLTGLTGPPRDRPVLVGPGGVTGLTGPPRDRPVLVGPGGPTGLTGPPRDRPVLVGPDGPTGIIGPASIIKPNKFGQQNYYNQQQPDMLVGPGGPTGVIGPQRPHHAAQNQRPNVLVGPDGPTGVIGPNKLQQSDVLVGPGGPTGIIGPNKQSQGVLIGPNGPTGIIGPNGQNQGVLVGPGGPTGIVGPNRGAQGVLVGPGGPTGIIGPQGGNFGNDGGFRQGGGNRGVLVGPGGPTGIVGPVTGGYGLLSSRQRHYTGPNYGRYSDYRRGDVDD